MKATPHFVVYLIHGTFARRAKWVREGSELRKHLASKLPGRVEFRLHEWSGRNRQKDRKSAAGALREEVVAEALSAPDALRFMIGHSHGGNVAIYALDNAKAQQATNGVICLNTPFIAGLRRDVQQLQAVVAFLLMMPVGVVAFSWLIPAFEDLTGWPAAVSRLVFILAMVPIFLAALAVVLGPLDWLERRRELIIRDISLPTIRDVPVLCLWGAGDEVIGVFALLEVLANLPFLLLHVFGLAVIFLTAWSLHYADSLQPLFPDGIVGLAAQSESAWLDEAAIYALSAGVYVALAILALVTAALALNLFMRLLPIGLPLHRFIDSMFVRLTFTPEPLPVFRTEFRDLALPEDWTRAGSNVSFLHHSSAYGSEKSIEAVADWMMTVADSAMPQR